MVFSDILGLENGLYTLQVVTLPGDTLERQTRCQAMKFSRRLFFVNFINMLTALISKQCLDDVGGFDEEILSGADDYELFLRITAKCRIYYLESILAVHRLHRDTIITAC